MCVPFKPAIEKLPNRETVTEIILNLSYKGDMGITME